MSEMQKRSKTDARPEALTIGESDEGVGESAL